MSLFFLKLTANQFKLTPLVSGDLFGVSQFESDSLSVIADAFLLKHQYDTDAEFIANSFEKYGHNCFKHLLGPFSCLIWDKKTSTLTVAKDPMGQRPLFYSHTNQGTCFSNSVKPLFESGLVSSELSDEAIVKFLGMIWPDMEHTCYRHIKKIPYGTYIIFDGNKQKATQYWSANEFSHSPLTYEQAEDYYAHFSDLYKEVIADYLVNGDPVIAQLSGGLDSTSIANIAASILDREGRQLHAIAHVPQHLDDPKHIHGWNHHDKQFIEEAANFNDNIHLHYVTSNKPLFHYSAELNPYMEQPCLNPCNMTWGIDCMEYATQLGAKHILTGQCGNSTISWPENPKLPPPKGLGYRVRSRINRVRQHYQPWRRFSAVNPTLAKQHNLTQHYQYMRHLGRARKQDKSTYYHIAFHDYMTTLNVAIRERYGIMKLDPTVDKRIIEFFLRTPNHIFDDGKGNSRLLIRKGLIGLMPDSIRTRHCRGTQAADWYYWLDAQRPMLLDKLTVWRQTDVARYLDIPQLQKLLEKWRLDRVHNSRGKQFSRYESQYRNKLLKGFEMGFFIEQHSR